MINSSVEQSQNERLNLSTMKGMYFYFVFVIEGEKERERQKERKLMKNFGGHFLFLVFHKK